MAEIELLQNIKQALELADEELGCLAVELTDSQTIHLTGAVGSRSLRELALRTARHVAEGRQITDCIHVVQLVPTVGLKFTPLGDRGCFRAAGAIQPGAFDSTL